MKTHTTIETPSLEHWLAEPFSSWRKRVLELLADDSFAVPLEVERVDHRAHVLDALRRLAAEGLGSVAYPQQFGGSGSPGGSIAVFETLGFGDLSTMVKFGVQFGLFGGSVVQLGTARHHERYLSDIGSLDLPGSYAMTEIGHGSNVRDIETRARYLPDEGVFEIHSPTHSAGKEWIGNAALHGRMATVFAQLEVNGVEHGVHAILVPIRDEAGHPLTGIRIEDNGAKVGLNGIDNGRIWFDRVRVPRDHLLDRFATVTEDGRYESPIESSGRRFFTMLGTLVAGRVSIAAASVSVAKRALVTAVRYSDRRHQFGPDGSSEVPILWFTTQRRTLLPRLATTYALHFAVRDLTERYDQSLTSPPEDAEEHDRLVREIEVEAAGLKAVASWHAMDTLQSCREAMGGRGFRADNELGRLRSDADIFTTFEGANVVLMQLVAKGLLTRFREEMGDLRFGDLVRWVAERAQHRVAEANPIATRRTDAEHLRDPEFHEAAMRYREERLVTSAARRLKARLDRGLDPFEALNEVQDHLVTLAHAHVERRLLGALHDAVVRAPTPGSSESLRGLATLYGLERLEAGRAWFLETGYFEGSKSRAVRTEVKALIDELAPDALMLVEAFGIPDAVLRARDGRSEPPVPE
jgi:acyl-CoA oxidase